MFDWFHHIGAFPFVTELRIAAHPFRACFPDWAVYSFPQAAWVWFGTMALLHVWRHSHSLAARAWVLVPCCLALGGEVAQGLHLIPGTFDLTDIVFSILALVAALCFYRCFGEHQHA
jgi:hypothetical protein